MLVDWADDGSASFHYACWAKLCMTAKGDTTDLKLCNKEVELLQEAKKTAEFHDSEDCFQKEAVRVAEMLKNSTYCIGFTGTCILVSNL
jgi:hypothetical protein